METWTEPKLGVLMGPERGVTQSGMMGWKVHETLESERQGVSPTLGVISCVPIILARFTGSPEMLADNSTAQQGGWELEMRRCI